MQESSIPNLNVVDFPNELWLKIISHLHATGLYTLGSTSRRFNQLISYSFWRNRQITTLENGSETGVSLKLDLTIDVHHREIPIPKATGRTTATISDMDLLLIMLEPPTVYDLGCDFQVGGTGDSPCPKTKVLELLCGDYDRLCRFISRVPSPGLDKVVIRLEEADESVRRETPEETWVCWAESLNQLFNSCIEKGCTDFQVRKGNTPRFTWGDIGIRHFRLAKGADAEGMVLIRKLSRVVFSEDVTVVGTGWRVYSTWKGKNWIPAPSLALVEGLEEKNQDGSGVVGRIEPKLTRLGIYTSLLVIPPFSNWTYQLIATSPSLTTLTLSKIQNLDSDLWKIVLTWLLEALKFHDVLKTLTFDNCFGLDLDPLLSFISGFEGTLENLRLTGSYPLSITLLLGRFRGMCLVGL
ncbi:hypothetical protein BDN72DRAFT_843611 [Pluteus cervinus]|uniref:Uncharacterized protein n=1 Tax=Pluteus cervinus TaxID=181527 RepID=A0ACD3AMJ1_9AGAR|nr:hypothetical protein BDN72DRAFT_843611 [Pluteus cervinus]